MVQVNVFRSEGTWFGALWIDGKYDCCDTLDLTGEASDEEAVAHAEVMPLRATGPRVVRRVSDTDHNGNEVQS
jgi:hypothetical protein